MLAEGLMLAEGETDMNVVFVAAGGAAYSIFLAPSTLSQSIYIASPERSPVV
jgi:hypothetical protein